LLLFSEGIAGTFATVICLGIGLSAGFPVLLGVIGEVFREWSGTAFSIVFAISVIGNSLINYLTGWITEIKGMEAYPYLMFGCLMIFILFLYITINNINSSKN
jgi:MFS family permease